MESGGILKLILNDYCEKVVPNLFSNCANIPSKRENIVSYPTHILNAVFTAASVFGYEHLDSESRDSIRDLKLLLSVLTLHDIGKYLENKYGISGGNSKENIKKYFETDDFKIREFFPEIDSINFNEIAWLIQNTELKDETQTETISHRTGFGRLADYSRLGDKIASLTRDEMYVSKIYDALKCHDVHVVQIPKFPQFLIRKEFLKALKKYHEENGAIPFLLFEDGLFYIHKDTIIPDENKIVCYLLANIKDTMRLDDNASEIESEEGENEGGPLLSLRIDFQSIDDNSILNFPLPKENKKRIVLEEIIRKVPRAMKGITIALPPDREFQKKLATIIYYLYKSKNLELLHDQKIIKKIESLKKPVEDGGVGSQKYKIYAAKELIENHKDYNIDAIYESCSNFLDQLLESQSETNVFDTIIKNISVDFKQTFKTDENPKDKNEMCFLCGSKTSKEYRAGKNYFLQARGFSKRGVVFDTQKRICPLCLIERNLIEGLFRERGYRLTGDYLFAIFYFDKIFANISYFSGEFSNVPIEPETPIDREVQFRLGNFDGLYFVMPRGYGGKEESARQSDRVNITKQILDFIKGHGCKATLTYPYTLLRTYNELFVNENPTRLEMALGIQTISDFDELAKKRAYLDAIYGIDGRKGYFNVQSYNLFSFIRFIKLNNNNSNDWVKNEYVTLVKNCFGGEIMKIEEIARKGKELYSTGRVEWETTYKRTVLMRTALDYILMGLQQKLPEDESKTFVCGGIYKMTMREKYAKKKDADSYVKSFVDSTILYLKEKGWFSVPALSAIEKYVVDTYEFALLSISKEV